ncbi:MAG: Stp1/IreP family PP2C-type Ser/Thr phosphatase [Thermoflexales bacterium]|nr:Stp1/IreP family PP2C-type Ser/Thr phosphatase [Thermoflexales bacterium]
MDYTTLILVAVGILLAMVVAYVLIRRERPAPTPPAEAPEPEARAELEATPSLPATPPFAPPQQPLTPQFFELATVDNRLTRIALNKAITSIGRAGDNDIVVDEQFPGYETVAEHHARLKIQGDLTILEDLASPSGLFVNDRRTGKNMLRNGWRVGLGSTELVFRTLGLGTAPLNLPETNAPAGSVQRELPAFAALPEGAIISDRYAVVEIRSESVHFNVYVIESLNPVRRCLQCGFEENAADQSRCINCNAALDQAMPYYPHYQAKETDEPSRIEIESELVGLAHPALLLPREVLGETPYGDTPRHYLIGPDLPPQLAATMRVPQKVTDVLEWGIQLAEGLHYLHQSKMTAGAIDGWRIALDLRRAYWIDFTPCEHIIGVPNPEVLAKDVLGLASILYYLMSGQRDYKPPADVLPPSVGALIDHALDLGSFDNAEQFSKALRATLVDVRRPSSMDLRVGRISDVGQVRSLNEDSVLTLELSRIRRSISEPLGLYVVADGMGGHTAGDVASALTVDTLARKAISELWMEHVHESGAWPDIGGWLKLAVQEANQAVFGRRRASTSDMGTTVVVALLHSNVATIAHAGDSRAYVINAEGIRQVTTDHSLVQRLVQLGQLAPADARTHPQRNVIYKNLGDKARVEPDVTQFELAVDDRLLLCSDGLNGMLSDQQIQELVMSAASSQEACRKLVEAANAAGGEDNISAIVVRIEAVG